jgi:hypothetical protein
LAGAARRARLVVILVVVVEILPVREPYEIVVVVGLEAGSHSYVGALHRYSWFCALN